MNNLAENQEIMTPKDVEIKLTIPAAPADNNGIDAALMNMAKFNLAFSQLMKEMVARKIIKQDLAGDIAYLVEDFIDGLDEISEDYPDFELNIFDDDEDYGF